MADKVYRDFTRDEVEAQYDNRSHVPEHARFFDDWRARSAAYRERSDCRLDVGYGDHPMETLDLFLPPADNGKVPVHAFIHGGYWRSLDKADHSFLSEPLVEAGAVVASINYALCPAVTVEEIVDQVRRSMAWLYRNAADFGSDPAQIHISGHSAGGHLVAMMLATDWPAYASDLPLDLIRSGVPISGVFELEPLLHVSTNDDLKLDLEAALRLSPTLLRPHAEVPISVFVGGAELPEFVRQSQDFATVWGAGNPDTELAELPGLNHFSIIDGMDRPDDPIVRRILSHMSLS